MKNAILALLLLVGLVVVPQPAHAAEVDVAPQAWCDRWWILPWCRNAE
ncbi:hypothetical protein [Tessaracoccus caeni]|nr:hypothetical protein [Tessaracoccus caeni]MDF1486938.1 hypothetical protein [Tessaracoccus caeni]